MLRALCLWCFLWPAATTTSCWSGFLSTMNPMPGMLVKTMDSDLCTTTTTATATATSTSTSNTDTTQTTTSMTATSITTTSISTTTITTTSVSATATTVTTTSVTATTLTTTSVTATVTTQTTTSVTVTTITTTSLTATTITTTSTTGTVTTWTTTSVNTTTSATVSTSMTTTETTQTSTSLTVTTITTTSISTTSLTSTSVTGTSTSVTTSTATVTSTTSSTTTVDCLDPFTLSESGEEFGSLNTAASSACNGISKSQSCSVTFGSSSASDLSKCVAAGTYTFFCPNTSAPSYLYASDAYIQCRVCAAQFEDTDTSLNSFAGKLMFGPNVLNGQVDETMLENYVIMPMDDCGYIPTGATPLAVVAKSANASDCCETTKYEVDLSLPNFAYNKIVILPAGTNTTVDRLDDGLVVDLVDLTTTSTTITTVTVTTTVVTVTSTGTTTSDLSGVDLGIGTDDCTKLQFALPLAIAILVQFAW
ncbi:unnamed protein product [Cladocopium goreaui]|uniref:Uncharacterized protein n=1 Tax=Cladocopium goreaui TaxID=2562237 RepID=A0A9P1BG49_9DINO|nr:unnamed protein product [Cladocopium goreaui]